MLCMVQCGYLFTVVYQQRWVSGDALEGGLQLDTPFKGSLISIAKVQEISENT